MSFPGVAVNEPTQGFPPWYAFDTCGYTLVFLAVKQMFVIWS